jgi:hypothetical protein
LLSSTDLGIAILLNPDRKYYLVYKQVPKNNKTYCQQKSVKKQQEIRKIIYTKNVLHFRGVEGTSELEIYPLGIVHTLNIRDVTQKPNCKPL